MPEDIVLKILKNISEEDLECLGNLIFYTISTDSKKLNKVFQEDVNTLAKYFYKTSNVEMLKNLDLMISILDSHNKEVYKQNEKLLCDIREVILSKIYKEPMKFINKIAVTERLNRIDDIFGEEKDEMFNLFERALTDDTICLSDKYAVIEGLINTLMNFSLDKKMELIDLINDYYGCLYESKLEGIKALILNRELLKQYIEACSLPIGEKTSFIDSSNKALNDIKRKTTCEHEFTNWSELSCSITDEYNKTYKKIIAVRKCKLCGMSQVKDTKNLRR